MIMYMTGSSSSVSCSNWSYGSKRNVSRKPHSSSVTGLSGQGEVVGPAHLKLGLMGLRPSRGLVNPEIGNKAGPKERLKQYPNNTFG